MEDRVLKEFHDKLDRLIRLLAINVTLNKSQNDQMKLLGNAGFKPKEIAEILGTTPNTIRVGLSTMRKKAKR